MRTFRTFIRIESTALPPSLILLVMKDCVSELKDGE